MPIHRPPTGDPASRVKAPRGPGVPNGDWQSLVGRTIEAVVTLGGNSRLYRGNLAEVLSFEAPGEDLRAFNAATAGPNGGL